MAEEVEEEPKKSNLLKIIIFIVGGFLLIAVGLGIGAAIIRNYFSKWNSSREAKLKSS